MTDHPITPPPELLDQWANEYWGEGNDGIANGEREIATQAARWGANMELDACCKEILAHCGFEHPELFVELLLDKRRPKPLSLKEQALDSWDRLRNEAWCQKIDLDLAIIRRALEAMPND